AQPAPADLPSGALPRRRRVSVSAEVDNCSAPVQKKVVPKTAAEEQAIRKAVEKNFLFNSLLPDQLKEVVDAMEKKVCKSGDAVIKEGDPGDFFYIIETGCFDVFIDGKNDGKALRTLKAGDGFGELALMYNAPRSATITAAESSNLWALDRGTFRNTIMEAGKIRRKKYEEFLSKVDLLKDLTPGEISQLADAVEPLTFEAGTEVIKEGDDDRGSFKFYIIESGEAEAYIVKDGEPVHMSTSGEGDFFGEKALVEMTPRTATVKASGKLCCAALSVAAFERLMGPCNDLLKERAGKGYHSV
ncbi:unnamed protein product, partial [Chrysoparadoxa australica]